MALYRVTSDELTALADRIRETRNLAPNLLLAFPEDFITNLNTTGGSSLILEDIEDLVITGTYWPSNYENDEVLSICLGAFAYNENLININLQNCQYIASLAFYSCSSLTSINFPNCSYIGSYAFEGCSSLTSANFPSCSYIGSRAFWGCPFLTSISFPNCSYIGSYAFYACRSLTSADFPNCSYIENFAFYGCPSLTSADFPNCSYIGGNAFYSCSSLTSISFPNCSYIGNYAFLSCSSLTSISFPNCAYIGSSAFYNCKSLLSFYFFTISVPSLTAITIFTNTPLSNSTYYSGTYGSIYVRESLLTDFKTASNWKNYSNRFVGLTDQEIENLN